MTSGSGLTAIYDNNLATYGYTLAANSYAGVILPSPATIDSAEVWSGNNGFDASAQQFSIQLTLWGRTSGTPTAWNDGTQLAYQAFADPNAQVKKTLTSNDTTTLFSSVWVNVYSTSSYGLMAKVYLYGTITGAVSTIYPKVMWI
jgi:hypothetical protein